MVWKFIIFTFCLIKSWSHDQSECTKISQSNTKFLAEKSLRSTTQGFQICRTIYVPFEDFMRIIMLSARQE